MADVFLIRILAVSRRSNLAVLCVWLIFGCQQRPKPIRPIQGAITESVYASGIVKSTGQYQAFAAVSGIIDSVYVREGQRVSRGQTLLTIMSDQQKLASERALLAAEYASLPANLDRLLEMQRNVELAADKFSNDSLLIGLLLGFGASLLIDQVPFETSSLPTIKTYPVNYNPVFYLIGFVFSKATTFFAGYFPARKASRIDPVIIIRGK